jgi:hypothetical protein
VAGVSELASEPRPIARELLLGLRIATTTIAGAVVLTASLPRKVDVHAPVVAQLVAYGALVLLLAIEVRLLVVGREWGRLRLPALAVVLGASILSTWTLRPEFLTTSTDWSFGTTGWLAVVLLFNRPLPQLIAVLGAHELVTVARAATLPGLDLDFVLNLVSGSIGTVGFPLACGIAVSAVRGIARTAETASAEAARIRNAEAVAVGLHDARHARLAQLDVATEPLLQGLADGSLSPRDPAVQRMCAVEAARMRRLLAETDRVDDPLIHELRHGADVAQRRSIVLEFDIVGSWPTPDLPVRRALIDAPLAVLATARTRARVSVIGIPGSLSVNVVADGTDWATPPSGHEDVEHTVITGEDSIWIEARWTDPSRSS